MTYTVTGGKNLLKSPHIQLETGKFSSGLIQSIQGFETQWLVLKGCHDPPADHPIHPMLSFPEAMTKQGALSSL